MSASTRTVQQPLGTGQLWVALAVVALSFMVALAIAFGARGIAQPDVKPVAPVGAPPAVIDHGWSQAGTNLGVGSTPVDHGSSENSMGGTYKGGSYNVDPGFAPRSGSGAAATGYDGRKGDSFVPSDRDTVNAGNNGPQRRAQ
jgi:hypothetical protein